MSRTWVIRLSALLVVVLAINVILFFPDNPDESPTPGPSDGPALSADEQAALDIAWMIDEGIYLPPAGVEPDPHALVTRGEFATFLYRLDGNDGGGVCVDGVAPFDDVAVGRSNCTEIAWLAEKGVTPPESAEAFLPDAVITRREVAEFLYRYEHPGTDVTVCTGDSQYEDVLADACDCEAIFWSTAAGLTPIIPPTTEVTFAPEDDAMLGVVAHALRTYREYSPADVNEFEYRVGEGTREYPADAVLAFERRVLVEATFDASGSVVSPETLEWHVTLSADVDAPDVGDGIFVVPGGELAPQGVAGKVKAVSLGGDGSANVTIEQVAFDQVFEYYHVDFSQSIDLSPADMATGSPTTPNLGGGGGLGMVGLSFDTAVPWYDLDCSPFAKPNEEPGRDTSLSGSKIVGTQAIEVKLEFENAQTQFHADMGSIFSNPTVDANVTWETVFVVSVSGKVSAKCSFQRPFHFGIIGPGGFRIDVDPFAGVGISVDLDVATKIMETRAYVTVGVRTADGGGTEDASSFRSGFWSTREEITVSAWVNGGIKLQLSWLGVIGLYGTAGLTLEYDYAVLKGQYFSEGCATGGTYFDLTAGAFFDIFFYRHQWEFWNHRFTLASYTWPCHFVNPPVVEDEPEVVVPLPTPTPTPRPTPRPTVTPTPTPTTTPPPEDPEDPLALQIAAAQAAADAAVRSADKAARDAYEAQEAADAAAFAASEDPLAAASAAAAAEAADLAAAAAAEAQAAADDAVAAAAIATTASEATIAQTLAAVAEAQAAAASAAAHASDAASGAILEAILPYGPMGTVTPVVVSPGEIWSFAPWHVDAWGDPYRTPYWEPVRVPGVPAVAEIAVGSGGSWLLGSDGSVRDLDNGDPPDQVMGLPTVRDVVECGDQTYAITPGGDVYGWGLNDGVSEILGIGGDSDTWTAVQLTPLHGVAQIDCDFGEVAARASTGEIWIWGTNVGGDLTGDPTGPVLTPLQVVGIDDAIDVEIGSGDVCAIRADGTVWCWGLTMATVDSDPYNPDFSVLKWELMTEPTKIVRVTDAVDIESGINDWFVRTSTGSLWGWGLNYGGSLGDGTDEYRPVPIPLDGVDQVARLWVRKTAHHYTVYALKTDGTVWAWGENSGGDLGDGTDVERFSPVRVPRLSGVVDLVVTSGSIYALDSSGTVWVWGPMWSLSFFGYNYGGGLYLRPIQVTHVEGISGMAAEGVELYVWSD